MPGAYELPCLLYTPILSTLRCLELSVILVDIIGHVPYEHEGLIGTRSGSYAPVPSLVI